MIHYKIEISVHHLFVSWPEAFAWTARGCIEQVSSASACGVLSSTWGTSTRDVLMITRGCGVHVELMQTCAVWFEVRTICNGSIGCIMQHGVHHAAWGE